MNYEDQLADLDTAIARLIEQKAHLERERDVERVEEALGDLDRLENELSLPPSHARS